MKTNRFFYDRVRTAHGFATVPVIVIGLIIVIMGGAFMTYFQSHLKTQTRVRIRSELEMLNTSLVMVLSNKAQCFRNVDPSAFGTTKAQLLSLSNARNIQIRFPQKLAMSKGGTLHQIQIKHLYFEPNHDNRYLMNLHIVATDPQTSQERQTSLPIYFKTNAAGNIEECFATVYPQPQPLNAPVLMTMEDRACQEWRDNPNYYFSPEATTCVVGPLK